MTNLPDSLLKILEMAFKAGYEAAFLTLKNEYDEMKGQEMWKMYSDFKKSENPMDAVLRKFNVIWEDEK